MVEKVTIRKETLTPALSREYTAEGEKTSLLRRIIFCAALSLSSQFVHAGKFIPSPTISGARNTVQVIQVDIDQRSWSEVVPKIESLLTEQGEQLIPWSDDVMLSIPDLIEQSTLANRSELTEEFDKKFGPQATAALVAVETKPDASVAELYAIAKRYPISVAGANALLSAGKRALELGDVVAANDLFTLANNRGLAIDSKLTAALKDATQHLNQSILLPFDASWYGLFTGYASVKSFPLRWGDRTLLVGDRFVLLLKNDGTQVWNYAPPKPWSDQTRGDTPIDAGRGPVYWPAVSCGLNGEPLVVVARQPQQSNARGALRGLRASDGKLLWTTDDATSGGVNYVGVPTVAGNIVYTVAVEQFARQTNLMLVAQFAGSGQVLWKRPLGTQMGQDNVRDAWKNRELEDFWRLGSVAVKGDRVLVTSNTGYLFCIDRFDGQVRWMKSYSQTPVDMKQLSKYRDNRVLGKQTMPPLADTQLIRFVNAMQVAGDVLVISPQDSTKAFGIDIRSGKELWQRDLAGTVVGASDEIAIFSGEKVEAVNARTGASIWTGPGEGRLTGPAVVDGKLVLASISTGLVGLNLADGQPVKFNPTGLPFRRWSVLDTTRSALAGAGLTPVFGVPREPLQTPPSK